jgi:hypothetical protein
MTLTPMIFQQDPEAGGVCPKIVGQLLAVVLQSGQLDKIGTHPAGALPFPGRGGCFRLGIGGRGSCGRWIERPSTEERGWKNPSATPGEGCIIHFVRLGRIVGAASAATFASSRTRGSGLPKQTSTATPTPSKTRVRGESPSYRNHLFVGAASAATLCVIENQGFRVTEAASTATLASSKTRVRGSSSPMIGDRVEGNGPRLPCLDPRARWEGQGGRCPAPIIAGS